MMAKRDDDSLSVALWNFGVERISKPQVQLGEEWSEPVCDWGSASLQGRTVVTETLPAFACVCFTLKVSQTPKIRK